MAWRITDDQLRTVVDADSSIDTAEFIDIASALVDQLYAVDQTVTGGTGGARLLSSTLLSKIELLLAAHFYSLRDQAYTSRSTGGASGSFQVGSGNGFEETSYGRNALALDVTGYLKRINRGVTAIQMQVSETYFDDDAIDPAEE